MAIDHLDITLLVDNVPGPDLEGEHGLSIWIETPKLRILFDTGQGPSLRANANKLNIDLDRADALVLSHGHYDHTGGVAHVLRRNPSVHLFCHPSAVRPRYSITYGIASAIHMPRESMAALDKLPSQRMHWTTEAVQISEDIGISGPIPRSTDYENTSGPFYLDPHGRRKDSIEDDNTLWINTPRGLVVCMGCCHAGVINTLNHIQRLSGVSTIRAIIGGFHLVGATHECIRQTVMALEVLAPEAIIACHCTGNRAMAALASAFKKRLSKGHSGMRLHYRWCCAKSSPK